MSSSSAAAAAMSSSSTLTGRSGVLPSSLGTEATASPAAAPPHLFPAPVSSFATATRIPSPTATSFLPTSAASGTAASSAPSSASPASPSAASLPHVSSPGIGSAAAMEPHSAGGDGGDSRELTAGSTTGGGAAPAAAPAAAAAPFPLQLMQQLLLSTLDPRQGVREQAEQQLLAAKGRDFQLFLISLALLIDEEIPAAAVPGLAAAALQEQVLAKQVAAVAFKNSISAKVANAVCQVLSKIGRIELPLNGFPELLPSLLALVTEATLPRGAAAPAAQQQQQQAEAAAVLRSKTYGRNALTCLSYLCEEHVDIVQETGEDPSAVLAEFHCNSILTAVIQGMKDEDCQLKIAALKALYHALIFAKQNFLNPTERTYIVEAVVENTKTPTQAVQVAAFECLVNIAQEYYQLLETYMPVIAPLSWQALSEGDDSVCIAAMELWNTLADIEIEIQLREKEQQQHQALAAAAASQQQQETKRTLGAPTPHGVLQQQQQSGSAAAPDAATSPTAAAAAQEAAARGEAAAQRGEEEAAGSGAAAGRRPGDDFRDRGKEEEAEGPLFQRKNCYITRQALPFLLPILLQRLSSQKSEDLDAADSWTPAMAAGTCLSLCAQVVGDAILPPVVQFVSSHFGSSDWTQREAAVFAFGSIMQGPSTAALSPLINESFVSLVAVLQDPSVAVRDTAAWTLGRIASFHASVILNKLLLPSPSPHTPVSAASAQQQQQAALPTTDGGVVSSSPPAPTAEAAAAAAAADVAAAVAAAAAAGTPLTPEQQQQLHEQRLQLHLTTSANPQQQPHDSPLLAAIVARLADKPRVAAHICWMLEQIATQLTPPLNSKLRETSSVDPFFEKLCSALIAVAERPDADEKGLREAAFTALASLIGCAGDRCKPAMMQMLDHYVNQLTQSFSFEQTDATRQRQGLLCGAIQVLCSRLGSDIKPAALQIWKPISLLFRSPGKEGGSSSSSSIEGEGETLLQWCSSSDFCTNDALLATASLVRAAGEAAMPFAADVVTVIATGLSSSSTGSAAGSSGGAAGAAAATAGSTTTDDLQTVRISVELIADISGAIGPAFAAFAPPLLSKLYQMLQDSAVERTLKPSMMTTIGDVAINIGGENFLPFLEPFIHILHQAGDTPYDVGPANWQENVDWLWYIHDLRESVMSAYVSIIYSMKEQQLQQRLKPYVSSILDVVKAVANTSAKMRGIGSSVNQALDLIFDLATTFGADLSVHLEHAPFVEQVVHLAEALATSGDPLGQNCLTRARWVRDVLSRVSHAAPPLPPAHPLVG